MEDILNNQNVLSQHDSEKTLDSAVLQADQADLDMAVINAPSDQVIFSKIILTGMGGSALAPMLVKAWLAERLKLPIEISRDYIVPAHVGSESLVIALSCSGCG